MVEPVLPATTCPGIWAWVPVPLWTTWVSIWFIYQAVREDMMGSPCRLVVAVRVFQELTPELSFQFTQDKFGISTLESGREANGNYKSDLGPAPTTLPSGSTTTMAD